MNILAMFVHRIDPIICSVGGICLWWYGLSYTLGFLNVNRWLQSRSRETGFAPPVAYDLAILVALGVILGGRCVEVVFYEWPFYRDHLALIPALWLGGMATHGVVVGSVAGVAVFCWRHRQPFLVVTDALAVPAALILGLARIGNFIDGQIVGSVTDVWWAVKFPDAEGFRHPVVLYDGAKNLLLVPLLICLGRRKPPVGTATGVFLFLYAFLRIFIDVFREYPTTLLGLATGQSLNILMSAAGLLLLVRSVRRRDRREPAGNVEETAGTAPGLRWRRVMLGALAIFSLTMPSDWTQDVPAQYGERHPGLHHSAVYPEIATTAPVTP